MFRNVLLCLLLAAPPALAQSCRDDTVYLEGDWGMARFSVEVADDPQERGQGLMNRETLPQSSGMLFVYPEPQTLSFWMRNTLIELDMIFADAQGVVRHIHHRAQPLDETPIVGGSDLTHVLEINGGLARRLGITEGTHLRHPSFDPDQAAAPC